MAKKFEVVERPQYFGIVFGSLNICRFPKRVGGINELHGFKTDDKKRAKETCKLMNERKGALIDGKP